MVYNGVHWFYIILCSFYISWLSPMEGFQGDPSEINVANNLFIIWKFPFSSILFLMHTMLFCCYQFFYNYILCFYICFPFLTLLYSINGSYSKKIHIVYHPYNYFHSRYDLSTIFMDTKLNMIWNFIYIYVCDFQPPWMIDFLKNRRYNLVYS